MNPNFGLYTMRKGKMRGEGGSDQNLTKIFTEFKKNYLGKTRIKIHHWISNPTVQ